MLSSPVGSCVSSGEWKIRLFQQNRPVATLREGQSRGVLCRPWSRSMMVKSDANDWSGRMQMGGKSVQLLNYYHQSNLQRKEATFRSRFWMSVEIDMLPVAAS